MTHNEQLLQNLYAELNMCMVKHDNVERVYRESVAQMNSLNERIIEQKKLIELARSLCYEIAGPT